MIKILFMFYWNGWFGNIFPFISFCWEEIVRCVLSFDSNFCFRRPLNIPHLDEKKDKPLLDTL